VVPIEMEEIFLGWVDDRGDGWIGGHFLSCATIFFTVTLNFFQESWIFESSMGSGE
jgi:hypothetical protein